MKKPICYTCKIRQGTIEVLSKQVTELLMKNAWLKTELELKKKREKS